MEALTIFKNKEILMESPITVDVNTKLQEARGIVCRQRSQYHEVVAQAFSIPYEARNHYTLSLLPEGKVVGSSPSDPLMWQPNADELESLDKFLFAQEESSLWNRCWTACCGCKNLRKLQIHFIVNETSGEVYIIKRDFKLGGHCCCCGDCNLRMDLYSVSEGGLVKIGRVREDFTPYCEKCLECCFTCTYYHDIERYGGRAEDSFYRKYKLRATTCCCGRVNNFCGATCCKNDLVMDILDLNDNVVAHLQKTYAPSSGLGAFCRCCCEFSNYILAFPQSADAQDRMLLITSLFQVEYQLFEPTGDDDN